MFKLSKGAAVILLHLFYILFKLGNFLFLVRIHISAPIYYDNMIISYAAEKYKTALVILITNNTNLQSTYRQILG